MPAKPTVIVPITPKNRIFAFARNVLCATADKFVRLMQVCDYRLSAQSKFEATNDSLRMAHSVGPTSVITGRSGPEVEARDRPSGGERMLNVIPLRGLPEIAPGEDLAGLLCDSLRQLEARAGDVLVVTQKIVSKAENCFVNLDDVQPGEEALELARKCRKDPRMMELVMRESSHIVRAVPGVVIARHRSGHVMANAGIDRSNLGGAGADLVLLLPRDSDASAEALRNAVVEMLGIEIGIIISDSFGRPWRHGVSCVAIGAAGMPALHDMRGGRDRDGRTLEVTQIGLADMAACAAGLAMGEGAEGIPAALIRGIDITGQARPAADIVRPLDEDLFR